ncbi:MAG: hypothetical protein GYB66_00670 [Chloroflexi bacterium]|nr:hypothetical protein [Chloroflexota bacterium]
MADIRNTQEIVGDFFGGLASLGAHGVDGLIISRALARLLIRKGILNEDEVMSTMREIATQEIEKADTVFVLEAYREILSRLNGDSETKEETPD